MDRPEAKARLKPVAQQSPEPHRADCTPPIASERLNQKLKRRTRVTTIFPSEAASERLVAVLLMAQSEQWETDKIYLIMEN